MDSWRVDELARILGAGASRRTAFKALVVAIGGSFYGAIGTSAAAAECIEPGTTCDPKVKPFGCCTDAVCLAGTDGQFRCCYPAGSTASCDDDSQCCS